MKKRKISAILLAVTLLLTAICPADTSMAAKRAKKVGNGMYSITSESKKEVRFDKASKKTIKSLSISATVKIGKRKYKVTSIKSSALTKCKKLKKLSIGKNVKKIGKKAICCKTLKTVVIKTKKLTTKSVSKKAFKLHSKATVIVPQKKLTDYQKLLKARGISGKKQIIKSDNPTVATTPKKPVTIPKPNTGFTINSDWKTNILDSSYATTDIVPFALSFKLPQEAYGNWHTEEKSVHKYVKCTCGKFFETNSSDRAAHAGQTGHGRDWIVTVPGTARMPLWYWTPDNTSCKVKYHAILPNGLTVNKDSIEVWRQSLEQIDSMRGNYSIDVSGQEITVTINDIKPISLCFGDNDGVPFATVVKFSAKLEETAANVNQVNANIVYNYGTGDKNIDLLPVIIRKKL